MNTSYNSLLQVDLNKISSNWKTIQSALPTGCQCIPVLKGNAYGAGLVPVAKALYASGANFLAVAQVSEGILLRSAGLKDAEVFVLGGVPQPLLAAAVSHRIGLTLFSAATAYALEAECARQQVSAFPVQIKIETGLHRNGVLPGEELDELIEALRNCPHLKAAGAFSHFAEGEVYGSPLTMCQFAEFQRGVAQLKSAGICPPLLHICNSGASEWFDEAICTGVRIGRRLYMDSQKHPGEHGAIAEACCWQSSVTNLRTLAPGETLGYDGAWTAPRATRVAVVCVGYADGLCPQLAAAHAPVLVGDCRAPLLSTCMDQCFVDVTDIPCQIGDVVTFFGESAGGVHLSAQEVASLIGDEGVFLTSLLTARVGRIYLGLGTPA